MSKMLIKKYWYVIYYSNNLTDLCVQNMFKKFENEVFSAQGEWKIKL